MCLAALCGGEIKRGPIETSGPSFGSKKSAKKRNKSWAKGRRNH
jgi:hypothetical protein